MLFWKLHKAPLLLTFVSLFLYFLFAYDLERIQYEKLLLLYSALFGLFVVLLRYTKTNFRLLVSIAILTRLVFLIAIPNLSQDFYRFIWDGRMLLEGFNPYLYTPESFITKNEFPISQAKELYNAMGQLNGSHFTNYPPIKQLCFAIAALISGKSILGSAIVLRVIIIVADIGTLYFGKKLLEKLNLPIKNIFWYILNPFIIIELTGNLHFEGVMLFFLVWSMYLLYSKKWKWAAAVFACSISVKLIPLMFLPLFYKWFMKRPLDCARGDNQIIKIKELSGRAESRPNNFTKLFWFYSIVGITTLSFFLPFFNSEFINNYTKTVGLWFNNFEFNASIYYIARAIGYAITGYNEIAIIGKILPVLVVTYILVLTFKKNKGEANTLVTYMLLSITIYLFFSTTVHPWYIATPLLLSIFTNYKFPVVWSFIIILSYLAYININTMDKSENLWIISVEYIVIFTAFFWEVILRKKLPLE
ncbi:mannosyltransferase [Ichthyenterobacterium sp. W332]|uniref:Mannosyltransferase n=1 Tax=Microcosmobacter mediterraneus TaxID=3075607 RepID=A0ABU2YN81_9FLAO|nr:mannosyltransferase [Ichthyenterobacterium sp. W332]MDT0558523.1 mannosyltransferase [Ichthyenterobacterium sp. W332]